MQYAPQVRPYAQAAFRTARAVQALPQWSAALAAVGNALALPEVAATVRDPRVARDAVAQALGSALEGQVPAGVQELLRLLALRGLLGGWQAFAEDFEARRRAHDARAQVAVESAQPLDDAQLETLRAAIARALELDVDLRVAVDPELLGGVVVRVGDRVIDGSVRGRLEQLAASLKA